MQPDQAGGTLDLSNLSRPSSSGSDIERRIGRLCPAPAGPPNLPAGIGIELSKLPGPVGAYRLFSPTGARFASASWARRSASASWARRFCRLLLGLPICRLLPASPICRLLPASPTCPPRLGSSICPAPSGLADLPAPAGLADPAGSCRPRRPARPGWVHRSARTIRARRSAGINRARRRAPPISRRPAGLADLPAPSGGFGPPRADGAHGFTDARRRIGPADPPRTPVACQRRPRPPAWSLRQRVILSITARSTWPATALLSSWSIYRTPPAPQNDLEPGLPAGTIDVPSTSVRTGPSHR